MMFDRPLTLAIGCINLSLHGFQLFYGIFGNSGDRSLQKCSIDSFLQRSAALI
ncbi:hypothetical protein ACN4EG_27540 [Alkalinema pantanalense CENA528]|uniref:hypothetical protein n=1 Tax=Alkalinema pantanalense TaxID=1620705 RepID=UPI003D6F1AD1